MTRTRWMVAAAMALLLAACGGGGGAPGTAAPATSDSVPAEVSRSAAAMTAWLTTLARTPSETVEPLDTDSFDPKKPENTEPETLR